ncbi:Copper-containing nitrite reductase protein [Marine Group I thaumarchaeote SCGC AAA799-E16]|uniref:Copper-containing nitrite reductase protein n=5 Tax=Marine Group I TaxID=905826 RepID=A0A087S3H1_9ARCH|nr:Copper-containing nitrite reductase protein [Marine Group I thaumarchaeote SCGC AAA799-N04]KER06126.1 Copper-containing nitrite reductase protein [Marine Group I thaumarchaeote SCGC AAA799-E16]KFM15862.1 Copper-containing nitrite reductase protein [Marine Group I thaumarchaeote SCGC AAA799-D11]KFM17427.1 Copper resistance protein A [Marine Group I thaumarchaeote SCGC RSA3]KFM20275.1 Copper-containing nitrite reductase protein [Marine Group I thaumarchaeote SCGC AAA799-P11]
MAMSLAIKSRSGFMMIFIVVAVTISSIFIIFPEGISAQKEEKAFVTHTGGVVNTSGEVLDPVYQVSEVEFDPEKYLREFNYGRVSQLESGQTVREFTIIADDDQVQEISPGVFYNVWTFNGTVPGPTIRATEGDLLRINFINNGDKPHTMHFHGEHPAEMDGVFEIVGANGGQFTYEFEAGPVGVHPYHCHVMPLEEHIAHGLYGVFIVDPKEGRPPADEMVMVLNGFDTDFDTENNFYAANSIPFYYQHHPIQIKKDELVRVYVVNMVEFDPINNLHLHGNLYQYYPTGTDIVPSEFTDMITLSQTERGIMEFKYQYPGKYLFHAHKVEFSEKGWVGIFLVQDDEQKNVEEVDYGT